MALYTLLLNMEISQVKGMDVFFTDLNGKEIFFSEIINAIPTFKLMKPGL